MSAGLLTRLRPIGAWRFGPPDGRRDRVEPFLRSDTLYCAVTLAMAQLGWRSHWLAETAESDEPSVALSSLYPAFRDQLLITPPKSAWPPNPSVKVRWKGARFVPLAMVRMLLAGEPLDDSRWFVEPESECLLPVEKNTPSGPFRVAQRGACAVDRLGAAVEWRRTACIEFSRDGALWCWAQFRDEAARDTWSRRLQSAFRLLADSGIGGERSSGWGHSLPPRFREGDASDLIVGDHAEGEAYWWVLSTFSPASGDAVDWQSGSYSVVECAGRIEGAGREKKRIRMIADGSVVPAANRPVGRAWDVAPDGGSHPVYAYGAAVAIRIPAPAWTRSVLQSRLAAVQVPAPPGEEQPEPAPVAPDTERLPELESVPELEILPHPEPVPELEAVSELEVPEPEIPPGPEIPTEPETPTGPEIPTEAEIPPRPEIPAEPEIPTELEIPTEPEIPTEAEIPPGPEIPAEPEIPTEPEKPLEPEDAPRAEDVPDSGQEDEEDKGGGA